MRKAASFVIQFLRGQSGAPPFEIVITLLIFGAVLAGTIILVEGSISLALDNL